VVGGSQYGKLIVLFFECNECERGLDLNNFQHAGEVLRDRPRCVAAARKVSEPCAYTESLHWGTRAPTRQYFSRMPSGRSVICWNENTVLTATASVPAVGESGKPDFASRFCYNFSPTWGDVFFLDCGRQPSAIFVLAGHRVARKASRPLKQIR